MTTPAPAVAFTYRRDPAVPAFDDSFPIIVFDGKCVLCSSGARLVMRLDHHKKFRLLAAQTPLGTALYKHFDFDPERYESVLLIANGKVFAKSESAIGVAERLGFPWSLARLLRVVPRGLRDKVYDLIARNRLRWFGERSSCFMPNGDQAERFLL